MRGDRYWRSYFRLVGWGCSSSRISRAHSPIPRVLRSHSEYPTCDARVQSSFRGWSMQRMATSPASNVPTQQANSAGSSSFSPNPENRDNYLNGSFRVRFNHPEDFHDPTSTNNYYHLAPQSISLDNVQTSTLTGNVVHPESPHLPSLSMMNNTRTWNVIHDDTHQAGVYEKNGYRAEQPFCSLRQRGSSRVDQDVGQAGIAASTFFQSLSPGYEPTSEQINLIVDLARKVMRNEFLY